MILNALCDYYDLLKADADNEISPYGFEEITASYVAIISDDGDLKDIIELPKIDGKKPHSFMMPISMKSSAIIASPVCDNFAYVFGVSGKKGEKTAEVQKFETAKTLHIKLFENSVSKEAIAIKTFFEKWDVNAAWDNEIILKNYSEKGNAFSGNIIFRFEGAEKYFHQCKEIIEIWLETNEKKQKAVGKYISQCAISGDYAPIAKLHNKFGGVKGASTMGASLVCFNKDSDLSYNLEQSYNSHVSETVMFKYSTALKYLLSGSKQKIYIGDDTTVFWAAAQKDICNNVFAGLIQLTEIKEVGKEQGKKEIRDRQTEEIVKSILESGAMGIYNNPNIEANTKFFVLGLAPNAGRMSVRYFLSNSFISFCERIKLHYDDTKIYAGPNGKKYIKISNILYATISSKSKDKKVNPLLGGAVTRAILTGDSYPQILLDQMIIRIKTEANMNQVRAATIKGYLVRKNRMLNKKEEMGVYLNEESTNQAYVLGRVFAMLEKIQKDALGDGINATIKDKYFASACSNPSLVFPNLIKLAQHHLAKIEGNYWNIKLGNCLSMLQNDCFPKILNMESQGRFILGYYQQNQKNYEKKNNKEHSCNKL